MIENTNTKQFYPGPILNNTLEITDFLFNDAEQIKIKHSKLDEEGVLRDVDLNYPTDYEVTKVLPSDINAAEAALTASTGQITLKNINVLAGEKLTVYRVSLIIQDKDYPRTGAFPAATHEGALDYLTMQNQEQKDEIDRALKVPISTQNFEGSLPLPIPSRALKINNDGTGFEMSEFDPDLALVTTEEFKNQSQQAAAEALASQNVATEQAIIATQQANIATDKTIEVVESGTTAVQNIDTAFNIANEWFSKLNAIPYIPVGTILPTTGAIDESLGYQRYANGQLIANVSSQAPDLAKFLEFQEVHAPNLLCSETEWQTALTLSTLGQVGKYVWNKEEDSVRIPRIVNIQGMMDMNIVGNMVEAGLPNITAYVQNGHGTDNDLALFNQSSTNAGGAFNLEYSTHNIGAANASPSGTAASKYNQKLTLDASRSSTVYGNSNTVQEESILYPYVLQIAMGVQYKTPVQNELERIVPYSFGNHKYSNVLLNNPAWMRSVGQWNSAKTHGDYYNWLAEERRNPKDIPARANVTKVGNVIDEGGVLSGFSTNNRVFLPKLFQPGLNSWEICLKVQPGENTSSDYLGLLFSNQVDRDTGLSLAIRTTDRLLRFWVTEDNATWGVAVNGSTPIQSGITYYFKIEFTGTEYNIYYSTDNITWVKDITVASTVKVNALKPLQLGNAGHADMPFTGSIDLNECYINIDGQRLWSGTKSPVRLHTEDYGPEDWVINQSEQTFRLPLVADRVLVDKQRSSETISNRPLEHFLYNDGWCEQLGETAAGVTVVLNIPYKGHYTVSGMSNSGSGYAQISSPTPTGFRVSQSTDRSVWWKASGYAEIPTEEQRTMNKYLYFYVGGIAKNEHLVDVGRIEEKLTGYLSLGNKQEIISWGMPDYTAEINISSFPFTAPCDGVISISAYKAQGGTHYIYINNQILAGQLNSANTYYTNIGGEYLLNKDDVITADSYWTYAVRKFYPLKGVN